MLSKYILVRAKSLLFTLFLLGLGLCVGFGLFSGVSKAVQAAAMQEKRPIYSVETDEKKVAMGINCAWGNEDIPQLLEILASHNCKATFFVVGDWCDKYPQSVAEIYAAGHEIGSHSDTHADMTKLDDAGILREICDSRTKLEAVTGVPVTLFRVPSGAYNSHVIQMIEEQGMFPIQWDAEVLHMKTRNNINS